MEHDERADELEQEADKLDDHSDRVGEHIEDARREWEAKEDDPAVPGAQPDPDEEEEEESLSEEGGP